MDKDEFEVKFKEANAKVDPVADSLLMRIVGSRYTLWIVLLLALIAFAAGAGLAW